MTIESNAAPTSAANAIDLPTEPTTGAPRTAGAIMLGLAGASLIAGAVLFTAGIAVSPPQLSEDPVDYIASLARDPGMTELSALLLHLGNLLIAFGMLGVPALVPATRGRVITIIGSIIGAGTSALLSGLVLFDFWTMSAGIVLPEGTALELFGTVHSSLTLSVLGMMPLVGMLAVPLVVIGLARARVLPWWMLAFAIAPAIVMVFVPFQPILFTALTAASLVPQVVIGIAAIRGRRR